MAEAGFQPADGFHNPVVAAARLTFTLVASNAAQIAKSKVAQRLKVGGVHRLRQELNRQSGFCSSSLIIFSADAFTILPLEEWVNLLGGAPPQFSFLNRKGAGREQT